MTTFTYHQRALRRLTVTVAGVDHEAVQLRLEDGQFSMVGEPFSKGRKWYSAGSWLIRGPGETYARAMTAAEFTKWSGIE